MSVFPDGCPHVWTVFFTYLFFPPAMSIARQAPLSMGFSRPRMLQWVAMPFSRNLLDPGIKPVSLMSPALAGRFFTTSSILAWRIPRAEEPGGLQSMGSHTVRYNCSDLAHTYSVHFCLFGLSVCPFTCHCHTALALWHIPSLLIF